MKILPKETHEAGEHHTDDVYFALTLDPTVKEHRIIALLVSYTSKDDECLFYKPRDHHEYCSIAPRFRLLRDNCGGRCFVNGVTCPLILERDNESEYSLPKTNGRAEVGD